MTYGSETWTWNRAQQSKVHAVEMSYLRGVCGVTRWEGESNESMYERCGMGSLCRWSEVRSGGMGKKKYVEIIPKFSGLSTYICQAHIPFKRGTAKTRHQHTHIHTPHSLLISMPLGFKGGGGPILTVPHCAESVCSTDQISPHQGPTAELVYPCYIITDPIPFPAPETIS